MKSWKFYGRQHQLGDLEAMLQRHRWFFAKVTGRRRIGKTALIHQALKQIKSHRPVFYVQIPDSEPVGVLSAINDALDTFKISIEEYPRARDLMELAKLMEALMEDGYILVLDEFQYFNRKGYEGFCSALQAVVDRLIAKADAVPGGLIVLGSIHTEMMALLDDRAAPLYNRVTNSIELTHLSIGSILAILRDHADTSPARLLFLWNLFEGVPKFYRDCYEQQVLGVKREALLRRIFFESSSPLRNEAENWFLRELHGRYDVVLKFVARHPGRMNKELVQAIQEVSGNAETQIGGYLKVLIERFRLIERKLPIFANDRERKSRYYLNDNFLRSWLAALANPVSAIAFRPIDQLVVEADARLQEVEGHSLEKLVAQLYQERSQQALGDFPLTREIKGFWDKAKIEIDFVAVNDDAKRIRFGSCKRSPSKLLHDINNFKSHVDRFLQAMPQFQSWKKELVSIAPELQQDHRKVLKRSDIMAQDLNDLTKGLK